jgi:hypothetical protein
MHEREAQPDQRQVQKLVDVSNVLTPQILNGLPSTGRA